MKKLLILGLLVFLPVSMASADLKIATVDLGKAFDQYYRTKQEASRLKEKQAQAQKEIQDKVADYQHIGDEVQKLDAQSKDQTLSPEARAEKAKALAQRGADLQAAERSLEEFKSERGKELQDEYVRRRTEVVADITKAITEYSAPQGFDLVLDKTSASVTSGVPFVLYNSAKLTDITPQIITKLNANAPAGGAAPTSTETQTTPTPAATH